MARAIVSAVDEDKSLRTLSGGVMKGRLFDSYDDVIEVLRSNSRPEGVVIRQVDSVTVYFASPMHRGAALRVPLREVDSYESIAERVKVFERDRNLIEELHSRRSGGALWESLSVRQIGVGARYLFPALSSGDAGASALL